MCTEYRNSTLRNICAKTGDLRTQRVLSTSSIIFSRILEICRRHSNRTQHVSRRISASPLDPDKEIEKKNLSLRRIKPSSCIQCQIGSNLRSALALPWITHPRRGCLRDNVNYSGACPPHTPSRARDKDPTASYRRLSGFRLIKHRAPVNNGKKVNSYFHKTHILCG